ncbi:MAG: hypothetical protein ACRCUY_02685 [Thermoguttaceae bacterium]
MTQLQIAATVLPNGILTIPLPIQWQSRNVKVIVEADDPAELPLLDEFNPTMQGKFSQHLFGRIRVLGDIVSPLEEKWEAMQ